MHVGFYEEDLKGIEIICETDKIECKSYKRCELVSAGLGQEAGNNKICLVALVSQIAIMQSTGLKVHK